MKKLADVHIHVTDGKFDQIENLLDTISAQGVTDACLMALTYRSISANLVVLYWKIAYTKMRVRAFGGVHLTDRYANIPYELQAEKMLDMGFDGIKLIDMCPDIRKLIRNGINHPKYDKMFSLLEERNTPVLIHVNDPEECWNKPNGVYSDGTYGTKQQLYEEVFEMLRKHPKLNVVFAHFFFMSDFPEEAARVLETYPNVRFDLTPGWEMYLNFSKRIELWHDFFVKYSDRILFGTDSSPRKNFNAELNQLVYTAITHDHTEFKMPCYGGHIIKGLALDEDTVERICFKNYIDFVGIEDVPVDVELFYDSCERVLAEMRMHPVDHIYNACSKELSCLAEDPQQKIATDFFEGALERMRLMKERQV